LTEAVHKLTLGQAINGCSVPKHEMGRETCQNSVLLKAEVRAAAKVADKAEVKAAAKVADKAEAKAEARVAAKAEVRAGAKVEAKAAVRAVDKAEARAVDKAEARAARMLAALIRPCSTMRWPSSTTLSWASGRAHQIYRLPISGHRAMTPISATCPPG